MAELTPKKIEALATEILDLLIKYEMWIDTDIYFNGKRWSTHNKETDTYHYNDKSKVYECEDDPRKYFEYVREPNILSMSFEGPLYETINCNYSFEFCNMFNTEFSNIFKKYGLYYELGYAWSLTCYEI